MYQVDCVQFVRESPSTGWMLGHLECARVASVRVRMSAIVLVIMVQCVEVLSKWCDASECLFGTKKGWIEKITHLLKINASLLSLDKNNLIEKYC